MYILSGIIEKPRLGRAARAWALAGVMLVMTCSRVLALGEDLLYTGTAYTVPAGQTQLQLAYNTVFGAGVKVSGASLRFGATRNFDWKLGYGYLWNDRGPNVQIGPSASVKWRFVGDGRTTPSVAISALHATNRSAVDGSREQDSGAVLIAQLPTKHATLLANLGRVWVDGRGSDIYYEAFAAGRFVSRTTLLAVEYVAITPVGRRRAVSGKSQWVLGAVYTPQERTSWSLQIGYLPQPIGGSHWTGTLGFGAYL